MQFDIRASRFPIRNRYTVGHCVLQPQLVRYRINGKVDPFFEKLWSHCILVMAYTSHQVWSIAFYLSILAMLESEKFPFPSYFYFASFDRGEEPITFLLARKMRQNATKQVTKIILGSKNQLTVILNIC